MRFLQFLYILSFKDKKIGHVPLQSIPPLTPRKISMHAYGVWYAKRICICGNQNVLFMQIIILYNSVALEVDSNSNIHNPASEYYNFQIKITITQMFFLLTKFLILLSKIFVHQLEKIRYRIMIPEFYVIQICKH